MERPDGGAVEAYEAAALEDAIDDRLPEILVMQHAAPCLQRFVGREDHRTATAMPLVDDVKEHVRCVGAVREIPDLVDHQDGWMRVGLERLGELPLTKGRGEIIDQAGGGREERIKAVLNGAIRNGDRQV